MRNIQSHQTRTGDADQEEEEEVTYDNVNDFTEPETEPKSPRTDFATRTELSSLREKQKNLTIMGSFLMFNEGYNKCVEVRSSSSSSFLELTVSDCSPDSYAQFFHWLPGDRLMSTKEGLCVGVEGELASVKELLLFQCDTERALSWECTDKTLLGVKGKSLYFNYGNSKKNIATLFVGKLAWSRWRAKSLEGKLQAGGACAQFCV
ncbi:macrophage mannose receptor 1-like [Mixophyes fleayi]|uniref:macrophage mannose receptor 1-like n=1 Tax=Mixophyes fleayi TaxID=3061075 RepID=UPI003F4D8C48